MSLALYLCVYFKCDHVCFGYVLDSHEPFVFQRLKWLSMSFESTLYLKVQLAMRAKLWCYS